MRVLYLHRGYFPALAGAETMARRTAELIARRGHDVQLVCRSRGATVERHAGSLPTIGVPNLDSATLDALSAWQPDIVHIFDAVWPEFARAGLSLARALQIPLLITPASAIDVWHDAAAVLDVCRQADAVFVLTPTEQAAFRAAGVGAARLCVLGQAADLLGQPDPLGFRRAYEIAGPLVLFIGRKLTFKGYRHLLAAAPLVWAEHPEAHFVFIGPHCEPESRAVFAAHADHRVRDIDSAPEELKHSALAACAMLCLPSSADIFPLVFVEAWMCGKPVISADFPGSADVVRHGRDGLIVAPDPRALAEAIGGLLADPPWGAALGAAGYERARQELNWDAVIDRIEATYWRLHAQGTKELL